MSQDPHACACERTWQPEAAVAPLAAHQQAAYLVQAQQPANSMAVASLGARHHQPGVLLVRAGGSGAGGAHVLPA
jgi:hypothetical protein